jgi:beta-hydroxylase
MKKSVGSLIVALLILLPLLYFVPKVTVFYLLCGIYDVARNKALSGDVIKRYFLGNGILTWVLSPFNILLDLLCLPYWNKGVYRLEDLPTAYRSEIQHMIDAAYEADLVGQLEERVKDQARSMIFFKWYGANIDTSFNVPAFHEPYRFIRTIGVSVFNKRQSTSKHFGPFRATLRLLYNINNVESRDAYIHVGTVKHYWRDEKMFIFDDTLQHQSFNETEQPRYCLFVDILRPTPFPFLLSGVVSGARFFLKGVNGIFYKNWKVIR